MPLNRDFIGREYPGTDTFEVGREHVRRFADALGDPNPLYRDREAARAAGHPDCVAPPTFLIALGGRVGPGPVGDPDLGLDYSLVVHGEQHFTLHRPVHVGDELRTTTRISDIRDAGRNELMTMVTEAVDTAGEPVASIRLTLVSRGTAAARPTPEA